MEPHVEMRLRLIKEYYDWDDKKRKKESTTYYNFRNCESQDFQATPYEKNHWKVNEGTFRAGSLCVDDPNKEINL